MAQSAVDDELWEEFHRVVNMTSRELEEWLRTHSARRGHRAAAGPGGHRDRPARRAYPEQASYRPTAETRG